MTSQKTVTFTLLSEPQISQDQKREAVLTTIISLISPSQHKLGI